MVNLRGSHWCHEPISMDQNIASKMVSLVTHPHIMWKNPEAVFCHLPLMTWCCGILCSLRSRNWSAPGVKFRRKLGCCDWLFQALWRRLRCCIVQHSTLILTELSTDYCIVFTTSRHHCTLEQEGAKGIAKHHLVAKFGGCFNTKLGAVLVLIPLERPMLAPQLPAMTQLTQLTRLQQPWDHRIWLTCSVKQSRCSKSLAVKARLNACPTSGASGASSDTWWDLYILAESEKCGRAQMMNWLGQLVYVYIIIYI
jgi:hypothetical protein